VSAATKNTNRRGHAVTAAQREQRDRERKEQLEALHGQLRDQVEALTDSEEWVAMLEDPRVNLVELVRDLPPPEGPVSARRAQ
jgi:hypothetical protein